MAGNSPDFAMISPQLRSEDFLHLDEVFEKWFEEEMAMRDFVDKFSEEKLLENFTYTNSRGVELENT